MPYTRRDVLRNAGLITAAGAAGCSLACITGCNPSSFDPGVRIFFEGSWLFCADPQAADPKNPTTMRAVSTQMESPAHVFHYGRWIPGLYWNDRTNPQLPAYTDPSSTPPTVTLGKNPSSQARNLSALFAAAQTDSPFIYLLNPNTSYQVKFDNPNLRVVTVPIPTKIIPAAFRTNARLKDDKGHVNKAPQTCDTTLGVPTSHIFEYQGADALQFSLDPATTVYQSTGPLGHYHFHTAPVDDTGHDMLGALLKLIPPFPNSETSVSFNDKTFTIKIGPDVPDCVEPSEFELTGNWKRTLSGKYQYTPAPNGPEAKSIGLFKPTDGNYPFKMMLGGEPTCGNGSAGLGDGN